MDNQLIHARRHNQRAALVLQMVLLFLMMALSGLIGLFWFGGDQLLFPPTPTPTATAGLPWTPTLDFRSTSIAEDIATQEAYSTLAMQLGLSPLVAPTKPAPIADADLGDQSLDESGSATATNDHNADAQPPPNDGTVISIALPVVVNNPIAPPATETPVGISELPTIPVEAPPTETPTEPAVIPSETPTLLPPTETPTPTPTLYFASSLKAYIAITPMATLRAGPSNRYDVVGTLPNGATVNLIGRDETGEWVVVCCLDNNPRWMRQVYVPPRENVLPTEVPTSVTPDDVRWLRVEPAPLITTPIVTPTPIPDASYPLYRRDRSNSGRVPQLPTWPLTQVWPNPNRAEQPMISPIVVANDKVIAASADNHLYAFGLGEGNQQWRFNVGAAVRWAPAVQDNLIYFADELGRIYSLQDFGNQTQVLSTVTIAGVPQSSIYLTDRMLVLITRLTQGNQEYQLYFIDRTTSVVNAYTSAAMAPFLAIGNQLVYAGVPRLHAFDINDRSVIWTSPEVEGLTAPPVFALNGPRALAELYVADNKAGGRLHAIDANTGQILWTTATNGEVNGMAVGPTTVYVTGNGFMRAYSRQAGNSNPLWEIGIGGVPAGGPLLDNDQLLIVTTGGMVQGINLNGQIIGNVSVPNGYQVVGAPAVSGQYLYIPTNDSIIYAFRGQAP
ncbi:MAG: PQQ-binding-like beta-propeller repeat protein [Caldilineaceae bacterium]|nr:PQQ-binding-like beta-propeller repeat protein [Caldilineaceae bacterium]